MNMKSVDVNVALPLLQSVQDYLIILLVSVSVQRESLEKDRLIASLEKIPSGILKAVSAKVKQLLPEVLILETQCANKWQKDIWTF